MPSSTSRATTRVVSHIVLPVFALLLAGCSHAPPETDAEPEIIAEAPVRIAPPDGAVAPGDCAEALRRAAIKTDLAVDRLATPVKMVPAPIPSRGMPEAVRRAKYNEVRVTVLVDTLGKADMKTFAIVKSTHPWLATSVKSAVAKWSFAPAQLAGCKVPRLWLGAYTSGVAPKPAD